MPSSLRTCLASPPVTWASRPKRRVRTLDFFSRMWERKALRRMILPVPVILKRLAAPRSVFILGIGSLLRLLLGFGGGCCGCGRRRGFGCFGGGRRIACRAGRAVRRGGTGFGGLGLVRPGGRLGPLVRSEDHDHVAPVELRSRLHLG